MLDHCLEECFQIPKLPESMAMVTLKHLASEIHLIQLLDTDSISNDNSDTSINYVEIFEIC